MMTGTVHNAFILLLTTINNSIKISFYTWPSKSSLFTKNAESLHFIPETSPSLKKMDLELIRCLLS